MLELPSLKITPYFPLQGDAAKGYFLPLIIGRGASARTHLFPVSFTKDPQAPEPFLMFPEEEGRPPMGEFWICKGKIFRVENAQFTDRDELIVRIKHAALSQEKELERIQREVQAFENLQATATARRERIPDDVKLFVWQRDEGKCVRCGGNERLEFDHIIPVAEGGANTARNIQLLCELCNRQKGKAI